MQVIHTSDWHLGRKFKGVDRTPEIEVALQQILEQTQTLGVDAILVAGDIFDTANPTAEAERVAYHFFSQLQHIGIPAIVIAGNHDSADRIDSIASLLRLVGVHTLGSPRRRDQGGLISLQTPSGSLQVGALPFASERKLLASKELWRSIPSEQRQEYQSMIQELLADLASGFQDSSVNILMAHFATHQCRLSHSEVPLYSQGVYCISEQCLPPQAQYIALGHIHRPQALPAPIPTYYSGSLIQVDFGEVGETKGFNLITVEPGSPAQVEFRPLVLSRPLQTIECDFADLETALEPYRSYEGYLKVFVSLTAPKPDLAQRIRKICPQALHIQPRYPKSPDQEISIDGSQALPRLPIEHYQSYYRDQLESTPSPAVLAAFEKLYQSLS
ncbi:MAG: exonuclease SbcCD subunit D [Synechococcaceae cyanobacterium SM2_3_2]|nr:exonuclease SbcCD subunit D [Synechococcaceae cyanobacterium SM2_3_2]